MSAWYFLPFTDIHLDLVIDKHGKGLNKSQSCLRISCCCKLETGLLFAHFPCQCVLVCWMIIPNSIVYLPPQPMPLGTSLLMLKICEAPQVQPENTPSGDATEVGQSLGEQLNILFQEKHLRCHLKNRSPSRR